MRFYPADNALIHHFCRAALDREDQIQYNRVSKLRKEGTMKMLLSFFQLSLAIRNVWPKRMSLKGFVVLYMMLLLSGMPVTLLSCIPYGLFGIVAAVCIYGLVTCQDTDAQNVCMGMIGFVLAIVADDSPGFIKSSVFLFRCQNDPHSAVLLHYAAFRQTPEKIIIVWQRDSTPPTDMVFN